jgi:predicted transposase YdaD
VQDFDRVLKDLFQTFGSTLIERLSGAPAREWVNVELTQTVAPRADLVARLETGELFQIEFQSGNDAAMPARMLLYYALLLHRYGQPPRQILLYVGRGSLRMESGLDHSNLRYRFTTVDVRTIPAQTLLESDSLGDVLLAILCRTEDARGHVRRILSRVAALDPEQRNRAVRMLLVLSTLRDLADFVAEETRKMGVVIDILQDPYFRRLYDQAAEEGLAKGRAEGLVEGEISVVRKLLTARFGSLPGWVEERLASASPSELETWAVRLLSAGSMEQVFQ